MELLADGQLGLVQCSGCCVGFGKENSDENENCDFVSVLVTPYKRTI